jgi:putative MATE family efflux protein
MLNGPILPTLAHLALPTTLVLIAQTAVNVAEAAYVGRLGTAPLAGVSLVFPIFMLMAMMSNSGIGSGAASAVARAIGAGNKAEADALVLHAIVLGVLFGALFTFATASFGPLLYAAMGGQDEALAAAIRYSGWLFAGAIPVWIVNVSAASLRGAGNVRVPALVTLIGAAVLIPFSPALIFGIGPIPRLGIAGAGIAFGIYYTVAALFLLRYLASGRSVLVLRLARLDARLFVQILRVGIPVALSTLVTNLTVVTLTGTVGVFGIEALAGYGMASRLDYVMVPLLFGVATSVLTVVGVNAGAGQRARARRIAWVGALLGAGVTELIGVVVAIFPDLWLNLFSHDPQVLAPARTYLAIVAPVYGIFGLGFVFAFAAQGVGRGTWPLIGALARMGVAVGFGWSAVHYLGAQMAGLSLVVAASLVASAVVSTSLMFKRSLWTDART